MSHVLRGIQTNNTATRSVAGIGEGKITIARKRFSNPCWGGYCCQILNGKPGIEGRILTNHTATAFATEIVKRSHKEF